MRKEDLRTLYRKLANVYLANSQNEGRISGLKLNFIIINDQSKRILENNLKKLVRWMAEEFIRS